jgi:peptide/nickel transport system substrate-binding protein
VATPIPVELTINANPVYQRLGELIQSMVRETGFNLMVKPLEGTTALDTITKGEYQMSLHVWSGRIDPDGNLYNFQHTRGTDNYANASDPNLDELLDKARTENNLDARKKLYADAIGLIQARRSSIYMYFQNVYTAWSARVQGYDMYADGMPRLKTVSLTPR